MKRELYTILPLALLATIAVGVTAGNLRREPPRDPALSSFTKYCGENKWLVSPLNDDPETVEAEEDDGGDTSSRPKPVARQQTGYQRFSGRFVSLENKIVRAGDQSPPLAAFRPEMLGELNRNPGGDIALEERMRHFLRVARRYFDRIACLRKKRSNFFARVQQAKSGNRGSRAVPQGCTTGGCTLAASASDYAWLQAEGQYLGGAPPGQRDSADAVAQHRPWVAFVLDLLGTIVAHEQPRVTATAFKQTTVRVLAATAELWVDIQLRSPGTCAATILDQMRLLHGALRKPGFPLQFRRGIAQLLHAPPVDLACVPGKARLSDEVVAALEQGDETRAAELIDPIAREFALMYARRSPKPEVRKVLRAE